jgi:ketosteroid isomerase-like protein
VRRGAAVRRLLVLVTLACAPICYAQTEVRRDETAEKSFRSFLAEWEEAQSHFLEGDPAQWKQRSSQGDDATIMGAFGGYEKGWKEVGPRYDWAAAQYKGRKARVKTEYLSVVVSGDMAFTVAIERQEEARPGGQSPLRRGLRATQVFRREGGSWKLLHRHADPLMEKRAPSAPPQE